MRSVRILLVALTLTGMTGLASLGPASSIPDNTEFQQQRCVDSCG
jgi:hypothetical protein